MMERTSRCGVRVRGRVVKIFFFQQKAGNEVGAGYWNSDVCPSELQSNNPDFLAMDL